MNRACLVSVMLLAGGVATAAPGSPALALPPAPDGSGAPVQPVRADDRRIIGILEVRVDGVPDDVKESFQRGLEDRLDTRHYRLISRARMKQLMMRSMKWTEGCLIGGCLAEVRAQSGAELVLLAALTGSGTSFGYVVTLVRTDSGRVLTQASDHCEVCTVSEAMTRATESTMHLLDSVPEHLPDEAAEQGATMALAVGKVSRQLAVQDQRTTRVATALTVVGLAAAAGGLAVYLLQGQPGYAAMTAVGGGALAASGIVVLTF